MSRTEWKETELAGSGGESDFIEELVTRALFWVLLLFLLSGFYHIYLAPLRARMGSPA